MFSSYVHRVTKTSEKNDFKNFFFLNEECTTHHVELGELFKLKNGFSLLWKWAHFKSAVLYSHITKLYKVWPVTQEVQGLRTIRRARLFINLLYALTHIKMDNVSPLPPSLQRWNQNIPVTSAAILCWWHHLESLRYWSGGGAAVLSSPPYTHLLIK